MFKINCHNCKKDFDGIVVYYGTGSTWRLYCCPHCQQLYAEGSTPQAVLDDNNIIMHNSKKPVNYRRAYFTLRGETTISDSILTQKKRPVARPLID